MQLKGKRKLTLRFMAPGRPSKKAGQPHPELNLVVDLQRGVPHPAHEQIPSSKNLSYCPVPGYLYINPTVSKELQYYIKKREKNSATSLVLIQEIKLEIIEILAFTASLHKIYIFNCLHLVLRRYHSYTALQERQELIKLLIVRP